MGHGLAQEWESGLEAAAPARVTSREITVAEGDGGTSSDENANRGRQHAAAFARFPPLPVRGFIQPERPPRLDRNPQGTRRGGAANHAVCSPPETETRPDNGPAP